MITLTIDAHGTLRDNSGMIVARYAPANVIESPPEADAHTHTIVRSGWSIDDDGNSRSWLAGPRSAFLTFAKGERLVDPILVPTHRDVISDCPSLKTFLRDHPHWRACVDPLALLTPSMLGDGPDHIARILDALAETPRVWCLCLSEDFAACASIPESLNHLPRVFSRTFPWRTPAPDPGKLATVPHV